MGTQNLLNYYFNKLDAKLNYSSYYDFYLASDEKNYNTEVVYSDNVIGYDNGDVLPVWFDLNSTGSSQQPTLTGMCDTTQDSYQNNSDTGTPQSIVSLNYWPAALVGCDCPYTSTTDGTFSVPNINLTGIDNGLVTGMTQTNGPIKLYKNLPTSLKFHPLTRGENMKMQQVSASSYSPNGVKYTISSATDSSGYYQELNGGFYQGFYKLYAYPYSILPVRPENGWSMETFLKLRTTGDTSGSCFSTVSNLCSGDESLNDKYYDNSGFFYYNGTRAENKFHSEFVTETGCTSMSGLNCCLGTISGNTLGPAVGSYSPLSSATGGTATTITLSSQTHDTYSNAFGLRITPDFKLGYRAIRFTGSCETTGTTSDCDTGSTFNTGYSIEEEYSDVICPSMVSSGNTCKNSWLHVAAVFERDYPIISGGSCSVEFNLGGVFDLLFLFSGISTAPILSGRCDNSFDEFPLVPEDGYYDFDSTTITGQTSDDCCWSAGTTYGTWLAHEEFRTGTLNLYVNGRRVLKVPNFEEIIPRALNQHRDLQVGVPFNMSWGGGSQGLYENMTFGDTTCGGSPPYQQDPKDLGLLIEKNFAGSWMGGISQMRYYVEPLQADAIYHNFLVNKDRYSLIDCDFQKNCTKKSCNHSQILYMREGNSLDIKAVFGTSSDNIFVSTNNNSVRFQSYTQENVNTVKFYKNLTEVNTPFYMDSTDTLEVVISKMNTNINATIILIGNLYK